MDGWIDGQMHEWIAVGWMYFWMDRCTDECIDTGCMDEEVGR